MVFSHLLFYENFDEKVKDSCMLFTNSNWYCSQPITYQRTYLLSSRPITGRRVSIGDSPTEWSGDGCRHNNWHNQRASTGFREVHRALPHKLAPTIIQKITKVSSGHMSILPKISSFLTFSLLLLPHFQQNMCISTTFNNNRRPIKIYCLTLTEYYGHIKLLLWSSILTN